MEPSSVKFNNRQASYSKPVKKVHNFFDEDDNAYDFETFEDDKDFVKMRITEPNNEPDDHGGGSGGDELGQAWGGKAYSLEEQSRSSHTTSSQPTFPTTHTKPSIITSIQSSGKQVKQKFAHADFNPLQLRDKLNDKFTTKKSYETSHVVKTSMVSNRDVGANKTSLVQESTSISYETKQEDHNQFSLVANSDSSIENVVQSSKAAMSDAERNQLIAEVKQLRQDITALRQANKQTPTPSEIVKKLVLNQPCVLEIFKSLDGKLALLDEAIKIGDGNALITILLFLKKTVKYSIFKREVSKRPVAVRHIVSFMKAHYEYDDLIELLKYLGRNEEAMMLQYKKAISTPNADKRLEAIYACQRLYEGVPELSDMVCLLQEHQNLIKRQIQIEAKDKRTEAEGRDPIMKEHPRPRVLLTPIISTLHYSCCYHYDKGDNILDPMSIRKDFKLTDKQFEWTAIVARAELRKWVDLEGLFTAKGWFGSNKQKSNIGFDKVVGILQRSNAPPDILAKYVSKIEDSETRLSLATNMGCHKVAVETIVAMKDKERLVEYRNTIDRFHPVQSLISNYLQNSQIKWR